MSTKPSEGWVRGLAPVVAIIVAFVVLGNGPDWMALVVLAVIAMGAAWAYPPIAVFGLVMVALLFGRDAGLVAAPLIVVLAARGLRSATAAPRSPKRTFATLGLAAVILLLAAVFGGLKRTPASSSSRNTPSTPNSGRGTQRGDAPTTIDWTTLLIVVAVVLVLLALTVWIVRRLRSRPGGELASRPGLVARLERLGDRVGHQRPAGQGPMTYADALAQQTGDRRFATVGPLVSGAVYESPTKSFDTADAILRQIESNPPPAPPAPQPTSRLDRLRRKLRPNAAG